MTLDLSHSAVEGDQPKFRPKKVDHMAELIVISMVELLDAMDKQLKANEEVSIQDLSETAIDIAAQRQLFANQLTAWMTIVAPNLTSLVGEFVGARLIAHAGGLLNLSKMSASTIQILGAEKAFARARKTGRNTPKYGIIYDASLISQAAGKNKGRMARRLAAKLSLCVGVDVFTEWKDDAAEEARAAFGIKAKYDLEGKLAEMEGKTR